MKHHKLKIFTDLFDPVVEEKMRAMVRYNDRDYQVGDLITMYEGYPENGDFTYTGRNISCVISYIDDFALPKGWVNISLSKVGVMIVD